MQVELVKKKEDKIFSENFHLSVNLLLKSSSFDQL